MTHSNSSWTGSTVTNLLLTTCSWQTCSKLSKQQVDIVTIQFFLVCFATKTSILVCALWQNEKLFQNTPQETPQVYYIVITAKWSFVYVQQRHPDKQRDKGKAFAFVSFVTPSAILTVQRAQYIFSNVKKKWWREKRTKRNLNSILQGVELDQWIVGEVLPNTQMEGKIEAVKNRAKERTQWWEEIKMMK